MTCVVLRFILTKSINGHMYTVSDGLIVCHLPYGPTASFTLSNCVMRHDIPDVGSMSEAYPHLIFNQFSSKLGERVCLLWSIVAFCMPRGVYIYLGSVFAVSGMMLRNTIGL